jgi:hypothetical protein
MTSRKRGVSLGTGSMPTGPVRTIASYPTYRDAERAVDFLSDRDFPVERVTIVGRDLQYVEQVTGRMGLGRAALNGAVTGGMVGLLIGWLFAVFDWFDPIVRSVWLVVDGLWFGLVVGALMGLFMHMLLRGQRDFASVGALQAGAYEVVVAEDVADEAVRLLAQMDGGASAGSAPPASSTPSASTTSPAPTDSTADGV